MKETWNNLDFINLEKNKNENYWVPVLIFVIKDIT